MLSKLRSAVGVYRAEGPRSLSRVVACFLRNRVVRTSLLYDRRATPVFSAEWDLLVVLDGCHVGMLERLVDEYEFLPDRVPTTVSVGGGTAEWLSKTFVDEYRSEIAQTTYITANPHARPVLDSSMDDVYADRGDASDRLATLDGFLPLWDDGWDADLGTVDPAFEDLLVDLEHYHDRKRAPVLGPAVAAFRRLFR